MKHSFSRNFARFIIRFRWLVLLLSFALIFLCIFGASRLSISNDYRVYFDANDPTLVDYERFQDIYSKADNIVIAVSRDQEGEIFEIALTTVMHTISQEKTYTWTANHVVTSEPLIIKG